MRWSVKVGRLAGIDVHVHLTFLLLLAFLALSYYLPRRSVDAVRGGLGEQ